MTKDEVIELAVFSGFFVKDNEAYSPSTQEDHELTPCLERFAKLVAAKEREACAKLCEKYGNDYYCEHITDKLSKAIRARGQA